MHLPPPQNPHIYHITHIGNLASICREGRLWSDAERRKRSLGVTNIGYEHIKSRRLQRRVDKAAGGYLGDYVPFYFCNRSIMLYVISQGHENYAGGQSDVVHLVSSVRTAVATGRPWAFTNGHAEMAYTDYFDDLAALDQVDWKVMPLRQWGGNDQIKHRRQAEFLMHEWFPWEAVEAIGVRTVTKKAEVEQILTHFSHRPPVTCEPQWYY